MLVEVTEEEKSVLDALRVMDQETRQAVEILAGLEADYRRHVVATILTLGGVPLEA